MASNSLFSTVTPCQQNFFWGEYCFAGLCCVWSWVRGLGHREDLSSGVEIWIEEWRRLGKRSKNIGCDWRIWVQMSKEDQLRSLRTLLSRSKKDPSIIKVFVVHKYKKKKKPSPYLWIPVFILRDVYKYFWKREMTCLCNIRLDLQSDAIVEPKTKKKHGWYFWQT